MSENERKRAAQRKYRQSEKYRACQRRYRQSEKYKITCRIYSKTEKYKDTQKKYRQTEKGRASLRKHNHSEKGRKSQHRYMQKMKKDSAYRLNRSMGQAIYKSLKDNKNGRHWEDLVDYTQDELREHLESLFEDSISWDNYGEWHIDHITPISLYSFNSSEDEEFKLCWSLNNLRPMWGIDNLKKGDKIEVFGEWI